ncbi:MAG: PH domain-containing protein [Alphaproteobacteria bacterium]|nr:PH domain-containing protein [Alphaproteobacteria bacterium]
MLGDANETALRPYLLPGERLLWTGVPAQGVRFSRQDIVLIPFSLFWAGFALFWNVSVWRAGAPLDFTLFGLPFLAAGLYITVGRFAVDALLRRRLVYAVTSRRVLMLRRPPLASLKSFEIGYLPVLEFDEQRGGRGTIRFDIEEATNPWTNRGYNPWRPSSAARCFEGIAEPRRVYDLIVHETERWRREQYGEAPSARSFIG